jgi:hypothetical protein
MRVIATILALLSVLLLLSAVSADTNARVLEVDGSLRIVPPGGSPAAAGSPDQEISAGSWLIAPDGSSARVELPGLGILTMTGPSRVRLISIDGTPVLVLEAGEAGFAFAAGEVMLHVEGGRLDLSGVAGYDGSLVEGSSILVSGDAKSARIEVREGSSLLSRGSEHARLATGETVLLPLVSQVGREGQVHLRSREIEILLPTEVIKVGGTEGDPALEDMLKSWLQGRESPRIP